jgi:hypothetical protein
MGVWGVGMPRFEREGHCKGCEQRILWGKTLQGKWTPVDPQIVTIYDDEGYIRRGHVPHHATCPEVDQFRKGSR